LFRQGSEQPAQSRMPESCTVRTASTRVNAMPPDDGITLQVAWL
jgi:hypothetical protein